MLRERTLQILRAYWSAHFGCPPKQLFASALELVAHGGELIGYHGGFGLFRDGAAVVSLPPDADSALLAPLANGCTPEELGAALQPVAARTIGPAWLGYTTAISPPTHSVRVLDPSDQPALERFQQACDAVEWDHGGSSLENPCAGVFADGELVSLAGYEIWGGAIAHISVVTHPAHRNHGAGRSVVAGIAQHAIRDGLLPQYRTLQANLPSIRIAEALGFTAYATSMAVRFRPPTVESSAV